MSNSPDGKQAKQEQTAAKDIEAGRDVIIGKIIQTIVQIAKPDRPRSVSFLLMRGGFILFVFALLVAAINGGFSSSNSLSTTYAPSTTVENKNTFLINNPPLSLLSQGSPSEAEKKDAQQKVVQYQQEVKKNPNSAVAHTNLGEALRRVGDLEGAAQEQQKALQLNPNMQEARVGLALVEQDKGNGTAARQYIQGALSESGGASAYLYQGISLYNQNDFKGAEAALKKAIELNPKEPGSHFLLGFFYQFYKLKDKKAEAISQ